MRAVRPSGRERLLDFSFLVGVALKVLNVFGDLGAGIPLLFLGPERLSLWAQLATNDVLAEDPDNVAANYVMHATEQLTSSSLNYAAVYFLVHGLVKVAILIALIRGSRRMYPWVIGALGALLVYQLVDFAFTRSVTMLILSVLDAIVIWLTWREWRHHRVLQDVVAKYAPNLASHWPFPSRDRGSATPDKSGLSLH